MKSFGQYFKYHFRSTFLRFVIMMAIVLVLGFVNFQDIVRLNINIQTKAYISSNVYLGFYTTLFATLCSIIPIFEFYGFKSRRNLDTMFTLPVSRTKMLLTHLLNGLIHVIVAFTAETVIIFSALQQKKDWVNEEYIFGYYFWILIVGIATYLFFSFIFSQGNTIVDSIVFMVAWIFVFVMPFAVVQSIMRDLRETYIISDSLYNLIGNMESATIIYSPFDTITSLCSNFMETYSVSEAEQLTEYYFNMINEYKFEANVGVGFICVVGVISLALLLYTFGKQRVEKVEDISNSPIGYKFLIPFYTITIMIWEGETFVFNVILLVVMFIAYIVYRRSFRIKKWDIVMLGIATAVAMLRGF